MVKFAEVMVELKSEFAGHPDLAMSVYDIANRCEWSDKYEQAGQLYQELIDDGGKIIFRRTKEIKNKLRLDEVFKQRY